MSRRVIVSLSALTALVVFATAFVLYGGYILHVIASPPEFARRKISLLTKDLDKRSFLTIAEAAWERNAIKLELRVASTSVRGHSLIGKLERIASKP